MIDTPNIPSPPEITPKTLWGPALAARFGDIQGLKPPIILTFAPETAMVRSAHAGGHA